MYLSEREGKGVFFFLCRALSLILDHSRALVLVLIVVVVEALVLGRGLVFVFNRGVDSHSHTLTTLFTTDHNASCVVVDDLVAIVVADALSIAAIGSTFPSSFLEVV